MSGFSTLETLAQKYGWVVKYAADCSPSIYCPIYKCKSIDLDPALPDHVHPAFIVNGQEIDRRLIAVYKGGSFTAAGQILALPNMPPRVDLDADELFASVKLAGAGFGAKTVADSGLLLLLARQNNWIPRGNNFSGVDYRHGTAWTLDEAVTQGTKRVLWGYEYEALTAHTSALTNRPDKAPIVWRKGKFVGGVPVAAQITDTDNNGIHTLTGSGPASWRLDGTPTGFDDLVGNCFEIDYGYRIVDQEIQILENNNAADPAADLSASSSAWKAILPNPGDTGHTLVAPGTVGTLKWTWQNDLITLDTVAQAPDDAVRQTAFELLAVNATNVPYVPAILQELGLFPIYGDDTQGTVYQLFSAGERLQGRGGSSISNDKAGLGCMDAQLGRLTHDQYTGVRGAYLET